MFPILPTPTLSPPSSASFGDTNICTPPLAPAAMPESERSELAPGLEIVQRRAEAPPAHPGADVRHDLAALDREAEPSAGLEVGETEVTFQVEGVDRLLGDLESGVGQEPRGDPVAHLNSGAESAGGLHLVEGVGDGGAERHAWSGR